MPDRTVIKVEGLSKKFCTHLKRSLWYGMGNMVAELSLRKPQAPMALRSDEFWALEDINFELKQGEALGVIGPNGAGKSTLLKLLNGLIKPDVGTITVRGRTGALIELGSGFSPVLSGRENIYINAAILGLSKRQVNNIIDEIIDFSGLEKFIDTPVKNYSSGMWLRLGYAIAAHLKPDILLIDEVLTVGDLEFRRKCLKHLHGYIKNGGSAILVSHNLQMLQAVCQHALLVDHGRIVFSGTAVETVNSYFDYQRRLDRDTSSSPCPTELTDENPVSIENIEISPVRGETIMTGDDVSITLHYRSLADIDDAFWSFLIWTGDQWVCITSASSEDSDRSYKIARGEGQFRCTVPRFPLAEGTYTLKAALGTISPRVILSMYGWENAPTIFTVQSEVSAVNNLYALAGNLMEMEIRW